MMRKYILATTLVFGLMSGNVFAEKFEGQQAENLFKKLMVQGKILHKDNVLGYWTFLISHQSEIYECYIPPDDDSTTKLLFYCRNTK